MSKKTNVITKVENVELARNASHVQITILGSKSRDIVGACLAKAKAKIGETKGNEYRENLWKFTAKMAAAKLNGTPMPVPPAEGWGMSCVKQADFPLVPLDGATPKASKAKAKAAAKPEPVVEAAKPEIDGDWTYSMEQSKAAIMATLAKIEDPAVLSQALANFAKL